MHRMLRPLSAAPVVMGVVLAGMAGLSRVDAQANNAGGGHDFGQQPPAQMGQAPIGGNFGANAGAQQGGGYGQSDFPQDSMHDWVVASARAARARAMLHVTESSLDGIIRDAQLAFENSKDYRDAVAAEKQAYDQYNAERQRALKSVLSDPKYQAAVQLRDDMADQLAKVRAMAKPNPVPREDLLAMASQKLQFSSDAHNMERDALDRDTTVRDARQKMVQANRRVQDLRNAFDNSIRTNPQIVQARRSLEMARVELVTAEAYYNAASIAGAVATDYSYYRHRWDGLTPPLATGWGPYGYTGY